MSGFTFSLSYRYRLSQNRLAKLDTQRILRDDIYPTLEFLLQKIRELYQVEEARIFVKIHKNINIARFMLLPTHE